MNQLLFCCKFGSTVALKWFNPHNISYLADIMFCCWFWWHYCINTFQSNTVDCIGKWSRMLSFGVALYQYMASCITHCFLTEICLIVLWHLSTIPFLIGTCAHQTHCWMHHSSMKALNVLLLNAVSLSTISSCCNTLLQNIDSSWEITLSEFCQANSHQIRKYTDPYQGQIVLLSVVSTFPTYSVCWVLLVCHFANISVLDQWSGIQDTFKLHPWLLP